MQERFPAVTRLQIHLPDQQSVVYHDSEPLHAALARGRTTTLTEWFTANRDHQEARDLLYADFPTRFTWHSKKKWKPRKSPAPVVGRMYSTNPGMLLGCIDRCLLACSNLTINFTTMLRDICRPRRASLFEDAPL